MGSTFVDVEAENLFDIEMRQARRDPKRKVRRESVRALVDTGSALFCLPKSTIARLGLHLAGSTKVRTGNGEVERRIYRPALITILGRHCHAEVMEVPDGLPPLVGFIPLESLDLVVDPKSGRVIPNPEHGGRHTLDLLSSWF